MLHTLFKIFDLYSKTLDLLLDFETWPLSLSLALYSITSQYCIYNSTGLSYLSFLECMIIPCKTSYYSSAKIRFPHPTVNSSQIHFLYSGFLILPSWREYSSCTAIITSAYLSYDTVNCISELHLLISKTKKAKV